MTVPSGLAHPPITWAEVRAAAPGSATLINMGRAPGAKTPYQLVWLVGPDGLQKLYQLVPEPPPDPTPA